MANRSISVTLRANTKDFQRQISQSSQTLDELARRAGQSSGAAQTSLGRLAQSAQLQRESWDQAGQALTGFGTVTMGALGLSSAAAVKWESQWAGVTKTVDGTTQQLSGLEGGLRDMARELPATHSEIAAVAEAAGALGVATPDVEGFTETMVKLGETTNLTADEAATSIAQISNVMGTMDREGSEGVERFGAALVQLGNNGASTERDILMMAQRISSTASVIGMSEADVLGYSNALASVGIQADAGGTAISRVFMDIASATQRGGEDLEQFASVAGVSAEDFATAFREDPARAVATFIQGLGKISAAGGDTFGVLDQLGMSDIRVSRALLTMAESGDLLTESLDMGAQAWEQNTALQDEFAKRLATTQSQLEIARNNIVDAGISMGEVFLPAIAEASGAVADFAGWFSDLPGWVHGSVGALTAIAGSASLAGGAFLLLFPRVIETVTAFKTLGATMPRTDRFMRALPGRLTTIGLKATVAASALYLLGRAGQELEEAMYGTAAGTEELAAAMSKGDFDKGFSHLSGEYDSLGESLRTLVGEGMVDKVDRFFSGINQALGGHLPDDVQAARDAFEGFGGVLTGLVESGDLETASTQFSDMATRAEELGFSQSDLLGLMPGFRDALVGVANDAGLATDDATLLKIAMGQLSPEIETAADSTGSLDAAVGDYAENQSTANAALQEWRDMVSGSATQFGDLIGAYQELSEASDDGIVSMDDWIAKLQEQAEAQQNWQDNILTATKQVRDQLPADMQEAADGMLDELIELGPEGAAAIKTFTEASAEEKIALIKAWQGTGTEVGDNFAEELENARTPQIDASTVPAELALEGLLGAVAASEENVIIGGNEIPAELVLSTLMAEIATSKEDVTIDGYDVPADQALRAVMKAIRTSSDEVTIDGNRIPADTAVDALMRWISNRETSVNVDADTSGASYAVNSWMRKYDGLSITTIHNIRRRVSAASPVATGGYMGDIAGYASGGTPKEFPHGGRVYGPGTSTSDDVPAWLSTSEFVQRAAAVKKYGTGFMYAVNSLRFPAELAKGYATGGAVEPFRNLSLSSPAMSSYQTTSAAGATYIQVDARNREAVDIARAIETRRRDVQSMYAPTMGGIG